MKTLTAVAALLASLASANAADLTSPLSLSAKDQPSTMSSWSGFYAGLNLGGIWGNNDVKDTNGGVAPGPFSFSPEGMIGGGQLGYNLQLGHVVLGVEGDLGYADLTGDKIIPSSNPAAHQTLSTDGGLYGDVTGRVGYALGSTLVYAKGGFAFIDGSGKQSSTNPGIATTGTTSTRTGWTVGGGVEYALSPAWSLKAEYQHFDFGSKDGSETDVTVPNGFKFNNTSDVTADTVKVGVNYHLSASILPLQ